MSESGSDLDDLDLKYNVELNGSSPTEHTIEGIFKLRTTPGLFVHVPVKGGVEKRTYSQFVKLATVRNIIHQLELLESRSSPIIPAHLNNSSNSSSNTIDHKQSLLLDTPTTSTMDSISFLKFASSLLPKFSGLPEDRDSFIENIRLLNSLATKENYPTFISFLKGRVSGIVYEACRNCQDVESIIKEIESTVVSESADVIEARINGLYFNLQNISQFCTDLDVLLDKFVIALVSEGVSRNRAYIMSVKLCTDVCRRSARNDLIKSIMASSSFSSHKEVTAKFQLEFANIQREIATSRVNTNQNRYRPMSNRSNGFSGNQRNFPQQTRISTYQYNNGQNRFNNRNQNNNNVTYDNQRVRVIQEDEPQTDLVDNFNVQENC